MKIKYEFADGTVSEVEVEESIGAVIIEDRRLEDNLSRKERYHCYSLEAADFEGMEYADGTTPEDDLMEQEFCRELQEVLEGLTDIQKQRVKSLTDGLSINEIARREGVAPNAVMKSVKGIRRDRELPQYLREGAFPALPLWGKAAADRHRSGRFRPGAGNQ